MKNIGKFLAIIGMMALLLTSLNLHADSMDSNPSGGGGGGNSGGGEARPCPPVAIPDRLPIGDTTDIQAGAWEKVAYIGMWSWASSMINANEKTSVWLPYSGASGVVDVDEIFGIIRTQQLLLSVLYPSERVTLQVGLYSEDGNLFHSYSESGINPARQGVSRNVLDVVLEMNSDLWIPFSGAEWFEIIERDADGNPVRYYSAGEHDIQDGKIRFPNYFSQKNGEVRVNLCDGTEVAYALQGGRKIVPTTVQIGIGNVSAIGMRTFRNQGKIFVEVSPEESARNIDPLSQVLNFLPGCSGTTGFSTTTGQACDGTEELTFAAWRKDENGEVIEFASHVSVWAQGKTSTTAQEWEPIPADTHYLQLRKQTGRYWTKFRFPSGWPNGQNQFSPPNQDDGHAVTWSEAEK